MEFYSDSMGYEWDIPSGNLTVCYWKWPLILSFPIKNGDFNHSYVSLPEGMANGWMAVAQLLEDRFENRRKKPPW